jgi:hypothetical protein
MTARVLRREALRRATEELNTASPLGLEDTLARSSAEVTVEAAYRHESAARVTKSGVNGTLPVQKQPEAE